MGHKAGHFLTLFLEVALSCTRVDILTALVQRSLKKNRIVIAYQFEGVGYDCCRTLGNFKATAQ